MKIAIYGAGQYGQYIVRKIQSCERSEVLNVVFIDNKLCNCHVEGIDVPVVSLETFIEKYKKEVDAVLIAVSDSQLAQEMILSLLYQDYQNILLMPGSVYSGRLPILNLDGELMPYIKNFREYKPNLSYIEYHVSDFCNLKCRGCGHFSNVVTEKKFPDIHEFSKTLDVLSDKFKNVVMFRLMGGEPFINPKLDEFILEVKRAFPYSDLRIVTNGLLFPQTSKKIIKVIRECNVVIDISQYPPTRKMIESIIDFAEKNKIKINIGEEKVKFMRLMTSGINNDLEAARQVCMSSTCHFLRGDRLFPCAEALIYENRGLLELDISEEFLNNNSVDLVNGTEDGWDILKKITAPSGFCKYCSPNVEWFDWSVSGEVIKKEDWIIDK